MKFQIVENGEETKCIFDTFEEVVIEATIFLEGYSDIAIKTINSSEPEQIWLYDYEIRTWVYQ